MPNKMSSIVCPYRGECAGCSHLERSPQDEANFKIEFLKSALEKLGILNSDITYIRAPEQGFRNRIDLQVRGRNCEENKEVSRQRIGLYSAPDLAGSKNREVINIESCLMLEPGLDHLLKQIQKLDFPIKKGSLRLRSFAGTNGIWLDFSNEDIKFLLAEARNQKSKESLLSQLLEMGIVEVGQRRKRLTQDFKLVDSQLEFWSETFLPANRLLDNFSPMPLLSTIAGFSQPGSSSNFLLIKESLRLTLKTLEEMEKTQEGPPHKKASWVEFGAGNGNLTFPFAKVFSEDQFLALEYDELSLEGLERVQENSLFKNIMFQSGNFQKNHFVDLSHFDRIILNPPRSGIGDFLKPLTTSPHGPAPRWIIYVSCYLESFIKDLSNLKEGGFQLSALSIVDQFPHTDHFETVAILRR